MQHTRRPDQYDCSVARTGLTSSQSQDSLKPCTRCQPLLLKQAASRLRLVVVMLRPSKQRSGVGTLHDS